VPDQKIKFRYRVERRGGCWRFGLDDPWKKEYIAGVSLINLEIRGIQSLDLGILGSIHLNWQFFSALFSIVVIDLILAGDNAVVIAMAVRSSPTISVEKGSFWAPVRRSSCGSYSPSLSPSFCR